MRRTGLASVIIVFLVAVLVTACKQTEGLERLREMPHVTLALQGKKVDCWIACKPRQWMLGFKGISSELLDCSGDSRPKGMCFVYPGDRTWAYTMRDVAIPLDLLLVSADGTVVYVGKMEPDSSTDYTCSQPARIALELPADRWHPERLEPGMRLLDQNQLNRLLKLCSSN